MALHAASHTSMCTKHVRQSAPRVVLSNARGTSFGRQRRVQQCQINHSFSRATVRCQCSSEAATVGQAEAASPQAVNTVPTSDVWELDFCSRPLLDERGKKVWELLITDQDRSFQWAQYFPNSKINSVELRKALEAVVGQAGAKVPQRVRFFRGQMQTIISKALNDLDIRPVPSRRCFALFSLLEERLEQVYKTDERYNSKATSMFTLDLGPPENLPDALRGEQWCFVQLQLGSLLDMADKIATGDMFGSTLSLTAAGLADLPKDVLVPGVAVFSKRSQALAAWTNALEIAAVKADVERSSLVLETGVNQRWKYGGWRPDPEHMEEAYGWEEAKEGINGLHFLAVQPDPDSESLNGLWLLQDKQPPNV